jgi:hypothetical protein
MISGHTGAQGFTRCGVPRILLILAAAVGVVLVGFVGSAATAGCRKAPVLEQTFDSPEAVARAVVKGLDARDVDALQALAVTEHEFRKMVWPKLPAAKPGRNLPWDYVWNDLHGKSTMQLQARVNEWQRGADGSVLKVEFAGETTDYETFRVRRKSVVLVRTADGVESRHRLFGSMIEEAGRYKIFSYVVD